MRRLFEVSTACTALCLLHVAFGIFTEPAASYIMYLFISVGAVSLILSVVLAILQLLTAESYPLLMVTVPPAVGLAAWFTLHNMSRIWKDPVNAGTFVLMIFGIALMIHGIVRSWRS